MVTPQQSRSFAQRVLRWFTQHGRHDLPWQQRPTPYRVWVSEIMLQQTQVATVIPYYQRFMQRFPTVRALAEADRDEVLAYWTGLGYYARARHLHQAAQLIVNELKGRLPVSVAELIQLPGIGRSTAGAIISLASDSYAPILDGNVKRVLTRCFAIEGYPESPATLKRLWELAETLTPKQRCRDYNQAMMDLGATVCTRTKPRCDSCPLQNNCQAALQGEPTRYPTRKSKTLRPVKQTLMLVIQNQQGAVLLEKRTQTKLWGELWSLPECSDVNAATQYCQTLGARIQTSETLQGFTHEFSHFSLQITPQLIRIQAPAKLLKMATEQRVWYKEAASLPGGLPAPVLKLLQQLHAKN